MENITDYQYFGFEELIEDPEFRNWVFTPTPERDSFWKAFISTFPGKTKAVTEARTFLLGAQEYFDEQGLDEQAIQMRLQQLLDKSVSDKDNPATNHKERQLSRRWAIAASIGVLLGLFSWLWLSQTNSEIHTIATNFGEWKTVSLPDGSNVRLNANSEIKFAGDWQTGKDREIWLTGEAFFEIAKDKQGAKFTVHTSDLAIEVLGTAFNVHSRGEQTEVFLEEGVVRLNMGREEKILAPGDFIAYSSKQKEITAFEQTSTEKHSSWKDGSLILIDKPVADILNKVEEIFGYEIIVNNPELLEERRTVAIPMDVFEVALPIMKRTLNAEITVEQDRLIVQ